MRWRKWKNVSRPVVLKPCICDGPVALPSDATFVRPGVVMTRHPEHVHRIHTDECRWSDQELPEENE